MEYRIAICDDNFEYLKDIERYLIRIDKKDCKYDYFSSGEDLLKMYKNNAYIYDAIFLDMEMQELNGIDTANFIRKNDKHVVIVFVTNHTKYMQKSFECSPFRFLVKPISFIDFKKIFDDVLIKLREERKTFVFSENRELVRLFYEDILFFENQSHWIIINTIDKQYKIYRTFFELHSEIDNNIFFKVHRSYIINLNYLYRISENEIYLYNYDKPIPLSRNCIKELVEGLMIIKERKFLL